MFVKVNLDDELYVEKRTQKSENSAELRFDEFWEVVVRVCNEKVPEPRDGPFEQTLDNWLRLWRDHILVSVLSRRQGRFISRYYRGGRHFGRVGRALCVRRVTWHRRVLQGRGPHRYHEGRDTGDADTEYRTNEDAANKPA